MGSPKSKTVNIVQAIYKPYALLKSKEIIVEKVLACC